MSFASFHAFKTHQSLICVKQNCDFECEKKNDMIRHLTTKCFKDEINSKVPANLKGVERSNWINEYVTKNFSSFYKIEKPRRLQPNESPNFLVATLKENDNENGKSLEPLRTSSRVSTFSSSSSSTKPKAPTTKKSPVATSPVAVQAAAVQAASQLVIGSLLHKLNELNKQQQQQQQQQNSITVQDENLASSTGTTTTTSIQEKEIKNATPNEKIKENEKNAPSQAQNLNFLLEFLTSLATQSTDQQQNSQISKQNDENSAKKPLNDENNTKKLSHVENSDEKPQGTPLNTEKKNNEQETPKQQQPQQENQKKQQDLPEIEKEKLTEHQKPKIDDSLASERKKRRLDSS